MIDTTARQQQPSKKQQKDVPMEDEKSAKEYYEAFRFDEQVQFFTDYMQAKMQPQSQLCLPSASGHSEDNFHFYT